MKTPQNVWGIFDLNIKQNTNNSPQRRFLLCFWYGPAAPAVLQALQWCHCLFAPSRWQFVGCVGCSGWRYSKTRCLEAAKLSEIAGVSAKSTKYDETVQMKELNALLMFFLIIIAAVVVVEVFKIQPQKSLLGDNNLKNSHFVGFQRSRCHDLLRWAIWRSQSQSQRWRSSCLSAASRGPGDTCAFW